MGKRMYWILKIIQDNKTNAMSAKEIVLKLQEHDIYVDIKTIYSCIQRINEFFYEWLHKDMIVAVKKSGFRIENEFFLDGELQFLLDSVTYHQDLDSHDKLRLKDKFMLLSSSHQQERLVQFSLKDKPLTFSLFLNLSTIMKAIENKTIISFQYINYEVKNNHLKEVPSTNGNNLDQYIVSPYQIILNNNHYYLISYNDKYKNTLTTYRIDRMRMIKTTQHQFIEIREQFDMDDEIEKMTNMYISKERTTLELECHQRLLREIVSHFGKDITAKKLYQETYLVKIKDVSMSEGLIGWIMMLQDQIKVVAPLSLQQDIKNRLIKLSRLYQDVI
ncbi:MAG: WYL domain-containing protein [Coprobacillus sp.]